MHSVPWLETEAKYDEAIKRCEFLHKEYQSNKHVSSYLPFQMGMIYKYGLNDNKLAVDYFSQFLNDSPDHALSVVAKLELEDCQAAIGLPKKQVSEPPVASANVPNHFELNQNQPNPFNPATEIRYQLPTATHVNPTIYNLLGQQVRLLIDQQQEAGFHSVHWDGNDDNGTSVASGMYLYTIGAGEFKQVKKMLLLR